jgi:ribosomal protein L11 methyltransferase
MAAPEKLYIYEIAGRINPPAVLTGEDFLGCWREGDCSYWFFTAKKQEPVSAWLKEEGRAGGYLSETEMNFADWEAGQPLKPTRVGGFYLCPIWETPDAAPGEILIRLEPGLAFGSGYHPTTRLCLELLRRVYEEDTPEQVLDLGTGSGILTLACLACRKGRCGLGKILSKLNGTGVRGLSP